MPTFKLHNSFATDHITLRDLLTHRSGLPRHDLLWYGSNFDRQELFRRLRDLEPNRDFRYTFQYQNMMYMVAGIVVEAVTGMSWEKFVQTQIFDRLGMLHSNLSTEVTQQLDNFAAPYRYHQEQLQQIPFFKADAENDAIGPAGNINSCVTDMAKWLQLHLNRGHVAEQPFISEVTLEQMHTPQIFVTSPNAQNLFGQEFSSYGMGWELCSHRGNVLISHGGAIDGFAALTSFMPRHQVEVVVLSNADVSHNPLPELLSYTIYDQLLNLESTDWNSVFRTQRDEFENAKKRSQETSVTDRKSNAPYSHAIESYLGDYQHPAYGTVFIKLLNGQLQLVFNDKLTFTLEHYHYNIFEAYLEQWDKRFKVSFSTDLKGNISQVAMPLEPLVKEIVFIRMPDAV